MKSVQLGVEDFGTGNPDRWLSAVRNLHAGILLLFKESLRRLSPPGTDDVLVRERVVPALKGGAVSFVGQGKKTASTEQIRERFAALDIVADWKRVDRVAKVRNEIEHHFTTANEETLRGLLSDCFLVVRNFMVTTLKVDPAEALGADTWSTMLTVSEVVEQEREDCAGAIAAVEWVSDAVAAAIYELACAECGSLLMRPTTSDPPDVTCRACGAKEVHEEIVERALREHFALESYRACKEGCSPPLIACPYCEREAYVVDEQRCAACGESCEHVCFMCDMQIPVEELSDGNLCGWCANSLAKDD
ncbi:MAG: hypothetical protein U1F36_11120 [Planctomycetota bacterium]